MEDKADKKELNPNQELFCQYYTQISSLFGNATLAYAEAYGYKLDELSKERPKISDNPDVYGDSDYELAYNVCSVSGHKLLRLPKINDRVRELLNSLMTNEVIDARLVEIIMKGEDKDSIQAIREYNKLKQRITEKTETTLVLPKPILGGITNDVSSNDSSQEDTTAQETS